MVTRHNRNRKVPRDVIGLIPAAGEAKRLSPLPCSKELFPVGYMPAQGHAGFRTKPICMYLLERMKKSGVREVYIILRKGKWDIPSYLGSGSALNMNLAYLIMRLPFGVPYTLSQAFPFMADKNVVFGFPDIIFEPENAFADLMCKLEDSGADIVLGLFPVNAAPKYHLVDIDGDGRVQHIRITRKDPHQKFTWIMAVWTKTFTRFMKAHLKALSGKRGPSKGLDSKRVELHLSHVIQKAIEARLDVQGVAFPKGHWVDIGTPSDLKRAVWMAHQK